MFHLIYTSRTQQTFAAADLKQLLRRSRMNNSLSLIHILGNPFISMEQFCVHVRRKSNNTKPWIPALKDVYVSSWTDRLTADRVHRAMQFVPLVSVLSYLYGRGDWLRSSRRDEPAVQSYARSLARHMDRIAAEASPQEALCPSN